MKRLFSLFIVTVLLLSNMLCFGASAETAPTSAQSNDETSAKTFMELLDKGDYTSAVSMFDATRKKSYTADMLKSQWTGLLPRFGTYSGNMTVQSTLYQGNYIVGITRAYEFYNVYVNLSFDADGMIDEFHTNTAVNETLVPKTYTQDGIKETHFDLVSGKYKLPAILTMPAGKTNVPAVLLVSGSGPCDRDETAYAAHPFKDIAAALAKKGIATLRYDKPTCAYQVQFIVSGTTPSIDEEYTQNVSAAVKYLTGCSGINKSKIYMLGHSEGGSLAPRISLSTPSVAGLILLAGSPRKWGDLVYDQTVLLNPSEIDIAKSELAEEKRINGMAKAPDETLYGAPASYIKDADSHDEAADAIKSAKPMLILQGERDAQVFMTDFNLWKQKLSKYPKVIYKSYPKLNHMFIEGTGKPNIEEYNIPGTVAPYVINDIASFVVSAPAAVSGSANKNTTPVKAKSGDVSKIANPKTGVPNGALFIVTIAAAAIAVFCASYALSKRRS